MNRVHSEQGFAYALVSSVPLQDTEATGIGIIFKARDRNTIGTHCEALDDAGTLAASYKAVMTVLKRALKAKVRGISIYVDDPRIIGQLQGDDEVPRELLGTNLQTRAMLHQVGRVRLIGAHSQRFSARRLAESARMRALDAAPRSARQLTLLPEDALA